MGVGKCQERQNIENIHARFLPFSSSHRKQGFCWRQGSRDSVASEWESEKKGQGGSVPRPSPRTNDQQQETHLSLEPTDLNGSKPCGETQFHEKGGPCTLQASRVYLVCSVPEDGPYLPGATVAPRENLIFDFAGFFSAQAPTEWSRHPWLRSCLLCVSLSVS